MAFGCFLSPLYKTAISGLLPILLVVMVICAAAAAAAAAAATAATAAAAASAALLLVFANVFLCSLVFFDALVLMTV